ncbi:TIGR01777 family oxidoreductase [Shewanella sp. JM162201]|uniref:TIGR01777 family oxidoreductase n=1 Tax=Shewanella jiangmenensis TaxID=2837387 RepID=A0ABS5V5J5_9GAMM|nr:TIGR01777 family oxidoreductase [Shewanella jiangmenensis]MBT1445732.1 TIGR01777 family oxidoreductase [Shewanella jiangmenensis]
MKILLTGATGFIGRQLVASLGGQQLTIISRDCGAAAELLGDEHSYLKSLDKLDNLNGFDAVINLAGEPIVGKRWSDEQKKILCHSRWDITSLLSALIQQSDNPPAVFISGSAVGFYGAQGSDRLTEDATLSAAQRSEFTHKLCAKWEQLALDAGSDQTRVCVLRTGIVLGKQGGALAKMLPPFKLGLGGPIGSGHQGMSWIHMDDMVGLIRFLLGNHDCRGVFNAVAPNPVSSAVFAHSLGEVLHRPAVLPAPAFAMKLMLGEASTLLLDGQFVLPDHAVRMGFGFRFPNLRQALENLL